MISQPSSLTLELLRVLAWGSALLVGHQLFWRLLDIVPLGEDRRTRIVRVRPMVGLLLAFVFTLYSAETLFERAEGVLPYARLFVLGAFFVGSYPLLRDFFAGIAIRSERSCSIGDQVRIGSAQGRITQLTTRGIALETSEGDAILIPYARAASFEIVRTQTTDRGASFTLTFPLGDFSFPELKKRVERAALMHHWTSVARSPEVTLRDNQVEATLFVLSLEHAPLVKASILHSLSRNESS